MVPFLVLAWLLVAVGGNDWTSCPSSCKCVWSQGKKAAECINMELTTVPAGLSSELQMLTLNRNNIPRLPPRAFFSVGLVNLHKLFLRKSNLEYVDKESFSGMKVLIEVDLSHNKIPNLHQDMFRECEKIREVILVDNPLTKLERGLFSNLKFLQKVDLTNCKLHEVAPGTFVNVPALTTLEFRGNNLTTMDLSAVQNLPKLSNLGLTHNPWRCDCQLRPLRTWVLKRHLYTVPTLCPDGRPWPDLEEREFACAPEVVKIFQESASLSCLVSGDPHPDVHWLFNGKPVNNHSYTGAEYILNRGGGWFNLTLRPARDRDSGDYKCVARSPGGEASQVISVSFSSTDDGGGFISGGGSMWDVWPFVVGVIVGAVLLLGLVFIMCCYFCKKKKRAVNKKEANGAVSQIEPEEKTLMQVVNPVQKPPRRQETALNSSETELIDDYASMPFNDSNSILGSSQIDTTAAPDLLAFSGRGGEGSPVSNPLHSPLVDAVPQKANQFGTLPYARSHSPFSPPAPVVPRAGYVTIPRRPRIPSWAASLSPVPVSPEDYCEPVYDNLGPRTTADGSSVLSLNKADLGLPVTYKNRPLPLAPYEPISEIRPKSWARATPDDTDERQSLITASPLPTVAPSKKVPPNPPPKPKKKTNVYEDEGEDGTEV